MPNPTPSVEFDPNDLQAVRRFLAAEGDQGLTPAPAPSRTKPHHLSREPVALRHGISRSRVRSAVARAD